MNPSKRKEDLETWLFGFFVKGNKNKNHLRFVRALSLHEARLQAERYCKINSTKEYPLSIMTWIRITSLEDIFQIKALCIREDDF